MWGGLRNSGDTAGAGLTATVANSIAMEKETRVERWLDRSIERAGNPRSAAVVIASVTATITIAAGTLMTVIDHKGFPSTGSGLWWAIQTVTTVGYGDHVPETATGQIVAALVMLLGIGFVTVITASITGAFVARTSKQEPAKSDEAQSAALRDIIARLERIEANQHQRS